MNNNNGDCKIRQTHKRLNEVHLLWHQANDNYFKPDAFITNINAAIQALRNLTFALQNEKKGIPNFAEWYSKWQNTLKNDKIMSWLCDARTEIVHRKDLEINSEALVTIYSYETILKTSISIPIFINGKKLLNYLIDQKVIDEKLKGLDIYASIQRRWRVKDFPEYDILYIIAYGIGVLYSLVNEAHELTNTDINTCGIGYIQHRLEIDSSIPICMKNDKGNRTENIDLKNFITRNFTVQEVVINAKTISALKSKYKKFIEKQKNFSIENPYVVAEQIVQMSKEILTMDKKHINILLYRRDGIKWEIIQPVFEDQTSKFIFWQEFAKQVKSQNIDVIIFTAEAWVGTLEKLIETGKRVSEQEDREEVLTTEVFVKNNEFISYTTPFTRNFYGKIKLEETCQSIAFKTGYIKPILEVWENDIK